MKQQIDSLNEELLKISENLQQPLELESYVKKLVNAKQKVTIVSNILQTTQDRLNKIHQAIEKESAKKRSLLESNSSFNAAQKSLKEGESEQSVDVQQ